MRTATIVLSISILAAASAGCASLESWQRSLDPGRGAGVVDEETVARGLREALEIGAERAVANASREGGFSSDARIRIRLPDEFESTAAALRRLGLGAQVDELEQAMNRAAERAAAEATPILWDAVRGIDIPDAVGILRGGDTAATDFLRERTASELAERFRPLVERGIARSDLARAYGSLVGKASTLPFVDPPALDLADHVTRGAIRGLFDLIGREEARIRADPLARTTDLLRRVFAAAPAPGPR